MTGLVTTPTSMAALPALVAAAGERASIRFLEFFAANIRNLHTRRAYYRAAEEFMDGYASVGAPSMLPCSWCMSRRGSRPACASWRPSPSSSDFAALFLRPTGHRRNHTDWRAGSRIADIRDQTLTAAETARAMVH
jgi:hypothetical protein